MRDSSNSERRHCDSSNVKLSVIRIIWMTRGKYSSQVPLLEDTNPSLDELSTNVSPSPQS